MQQQHHHDTEPGGSCSTAAASAPLTWNGFQRANAGRGWTKEEWRRQWQLHKQQQQRQPAATGNTTHGTRAATRLAGLRAGIAALASSGSRADAAAAPQPAGACSSTPIKQQQQQVAPTATSTPAAAAVSQPSSSSSSTAPASAVRPSVSPSPSPSAAPTPSVHELLKLRTAVHQLLGTQGAALAHAHDACSPASPPAAHAGCLGALTAAARRRDTPKLPWNRFQKACKGRGMSKAELSAAFAAAKRQQAQLGGPLGLDSFLDAWVEQQRKHERQQQQQHEAASRWGTLKHWVQSRTGSRAASRAVSRGVSPCSSPAAPLAVEQQPAAGKWGVLKQWVQSRSSSRAGSRLASPALSPEDKQQQAGQQQRHQQAGQQQRHQQAAGDSIEAEAADSSLPFAAQLSLAAAACNVNGSSRSTALQPEAPHTPQAGTHALDALPAAAAAAGSDSPSSHVASSSLPIGSRRGMLLLPCGASCPAVWIGQRVAREMVPNGLPGLLGGFCAWQPVQTGAPQQLKGLKRLVPARPGVYEWGVRLPQRSGGGSRDKGYCPVLAFYLGKAGTLRQRPRRTTARDGVAGETLRTRLNRYLITSRVRVGPQQEVHKDRMFAQYQQAGGQLFYRWWVASGTEEPVEMERALLARLDYAANYQHNLDRRRLLTHRA